MPRTKIQLLQQNSAIEQRWALILDSLCITIVLDYAHHVLRQAVLFLGRDLSNDEWRRGKGLALHDIHRLNNPLPHVRVRSTLHRVPVATFQVTSRLGQPNAAQTRSEPVLQCRSQEEPADRCNETFSLKTRSTINSPSPSRPGLILSTEYCWSPSCYFPQQPIFALCTCRYCNLISPAIARH